MSGGSRKATTVLNKMLSFMEKSRADDMQEQDTLDSFNELNENMSSWEESLERLEELKHKRSKL